MICATTNFYFCILLATMSQAYGHRTIDADDESIVPVAVKCCPRAAQKCCSTALRRGSPLRCDEISDERLLPTIKCLETTIFGAMHLNHTFLPCCESYRVDGWCFTKCRNAFLAPSMPPKRKLDFRQGMRCRSSGSKATLCFNRCAYWTLNNADPFFPSEHSVCTDLEEESSKMYFGEELGF